ncbi:MAG TPA: signal peptidase II [Kofleriaceae bacterium]|nr:signal peptidase II [Kofleriaceae bacterium]
MADDRPSFSARARWLAPGVAFAIALAADQSTKVLARHELTPGRVSPVIRGFWDWELAENPGAAFSTFSDGTARWLLASIALVAIVAIGWMIARSAPQQRVQRLALGLVAGGALGNLVDRVAFGVVTDFVRWRWHAHRWPVFNVADAALLVGAVLLVVDSFRKPPSPAPTT